MDKEDQGFSITQDGRLVDLQVRRLEQILVNILNICNRPGSCDIKLSAIETLCETAMEHEI